MANPSEGGRKRKKYEVRQPLPITLIEPEPQTFPRHFILTSGEENFKKVSPIKLFFTINAELGEVKKISKSRNGSVFIEVFTKEQSMKISRMTHLGEQAVEVNSNERLNLSRGVITCRDLLNCSNEEILNCLEKYGAKSVENMKRKVNGELVDTGSFLVAFSCPSLPTDVKIAFYILKVRPYVPRPRRCFKCQRFGHPAARCRSEETICACGRPQHEDTCQEPPVCVNCKGKHKASDAQCPAFQLEREIQKIKITEKVSFFEARAKARNLVRPNVSFADMLSKQSKTLAPSETHTRKLAATQINTAQKSRQQDQSPGFPTKSALLGGKISRVAKISTHSPTSIAPTPSSPSNLHPTPPLSTTYSPAPLQPPSDLYAFKAPPKKDYSRLKATSSSISSDTADDI